MSSTRFVGEFRQLNLLPVTSETGESAKPLQEHDSTHMSGDAKAENPPLNFEKEWPLELSEEVRTPNTDRLPIIPDRVEIAEFFATEDALESLAFRTLLHEAEFWRLTGAS